MRKKERVNTAVPVGLLYLYFPSLFFKEGASSRLTREVSASAPIAIEGVFGCSVFPSLSASDGEGCPTGRGEVAVAMEVITTKTHYPTK